MGHRASEAQRRRGKVFISYRREGGSELARLVAESLRHRGYQVFMDVEDLRSGPFNTALFREIETATDVVVILTVGSLDRCHVEDDWVRLEIAHAISLKKNIVPVMARGFAWPDPSRPLTDDLAALPTYNGITPSHEYFEASVGKLAGLLVSRPEERRSESAPRSVLMGALVFAAVAGLAIIFAPQFRPTEGRIAVGEKPSHDGTPHENVGRDTVTNATEAIRPKNAGAPNIVSSYRTLADDLARAVAGPPVPIAVGNFLYEDTELMSFFSSVLRQELELALAATGKFKIVARDRLADLQAELLFEGTSLLEPGSEPTAGAPPRHGLKVPVSAVEGIVRGRFYHKPPAITIYAELVVLADGTVRKAKAILPPQVIATDIVPSSLSTQSSEAPSLKRIEALVRPQSLAQSQANLADVQQRIAKITHDFKLQIVVKEAKRDFAEGETVSYRLCSDTDCHVAVFCHQVDGSTVVLFPNAHNRDTWVTADSRVDIPGMDKRGFQIVIGPPFGTDVVQVIACTKASALHRMTRDLVGGTSPDASAYRGIDRGMVVQGLNDSLAEPQQDPAGPAHWSEAHIVVCTYPKMMH